MTISLSVCLSVCVGVCLCLMSLHVVTGCPKSWLYGCTKRQLNNFSKKAVLTWQPSEIQKYSKSLCACALYMALCSWWLNWSLLSSLKLRAGVVFKRTEYNEFTNPRFTVTFSVESAGVDLDPSNNMVSTTINVFRVADLYVAKYVYSVQCVRPLASAPMQWEQWERVHLVVQQWLHYKWLSSDSFLWLVV